MDKTLVCGAIALWTGGLFASACGGAEQPEESGSTTTQAIYGPTVNNWTPDDTVIDGVGWDTMTYDKCQMKCASDSPPYTDVDGNTTCLDGSVMALRCAPSVARCSGTLIAPDLFLTAAHCLCRLPSNAVHSIMFPRDPSQPFQGRLLSYRTDDCGGSYEDDASKDLALVRLDAPVPNTIVSFPLLRPWLWRDFDDKRDDGYFSQFAHGAGYGGTNAPNDQGTLAHGFVFSWNIVSANSWVPFAVSSGSSWIASDRDTNDGASFAQGDSGSPFLVWAEPEQRYYIGGVLSKFSDTWEVDLASPTWNNGDGNGNWLAGYIGAQSDLDRDDHTDEIDNCSLQNSIVAEFCGRSQSACFNPNQLDSDEDGIGNVCDNCPQRENPFQTDTDHDGSGDACDTCPLDAGADPDDYPDSDGVGAGCDSCPSLPNPFKACTTDADCNGTRCFPETNRCGRQFDDSDRDGIGDSCDTCALVSNEGVTANSNDRAEVREPSPVPALGDICDPVPLYTPEPIIPQYAAGVTFDPNATTRNPANSVEFTGAAQIGLDIPAGSVPGYPESFPQKQHSGNVGFRHCNCIIGETIQTFDECVATTCALNQNSYGDPTSPWQPVHIAVSPLSMPADFSLDQAPGYELGRLYRSSIFEDPFPHPGIRQGQRRMGEADRLTWSFWKDIDANGGPVKSIPFSGAMRRTAGIFWSHGIMNSPASFRDGGTSGRLRDVYRYVMTPLYQAAGEFPSAGTFPAGAMPWLSPGMLPVDPDVRISDLGVRGVIDAPARIGRINGRLVVQGRGKRYDVTDWIDPAVADLLQTAGTRWLSPADAGDLVRTAVSPTQFVAIESPWTGTKPVREFVATTAGRLTARTVPATTRVPSARSNAKAVFSNAERSIYLVGGSRTRADGSTMWLSELWRFGLDTGAWTRVDFRVPSTAVAIANAMAIAYDSPRHRLYLAGKNTVMTGGSTANEVQLVQVDMSTGTSRPLMSFPSLYGLARVSLAIDAWGTVVLAAQKDGFVHVFEIDVQPARPQLVGYVKLTGTLDDELLAPDLLYVPLLSNGVKSVSKLTRAQLAQKVGLGAMPDTDKDLVPDLVDDCPGTYNPTQQGCSVFTDAVLHATQRLTLADNVHVSGAAGAGTLMVSAGTQLTQVGVSGRIGTLVSKGAVELKDRAQAAGSITSTGTITFRSEAVALGGSKALVPVSLPAISPISVQYPTPSGGAITVASNQNRSLAPGSYGAVTLYAKAYVRLTGGDYYFTSLLLEPGAAFVIDSSNAPVRIYVKTSLVDRGYMIDANGGAPNVVLVYTGTLTAPIETPFRGVLVAPSAKIVLSSNHHSGAFFGKEIEVQANARITHQPSQVRWNP